MPFLGRPKGDHAAQSTSRHGSPFSTTQLLPIPSGHSDRSVGGSRRSSRAMALSDVTSPGAASGGFAAPLAPPPPLNFSAGVDVPVSVEEARHEACASASRPDEKRPLATYYLPGKSPIASAYARKAGGLEVPRSHAAESMRGAFGSTPPGVVMEAAESVSMLSGPGDPRRSSWHAPSGGQMRKAARLAAGGWGAAARTPKTSGDAQGGRATPQSLANAATRPRLPKYGAGRAAWGPDGGGHANVGGGGYESDDGIDLDGADGYRRAQMHESGSDEGEDRRITWFGLRKRGGAGGGGGGGGRGARDPESSPPRGKPEDGTPDDANEVRLRFPQAPFHSEQSAWADLSDSSIGGHGSSHVESLGGREKKPRLAQLHYDPRAEPQQRSPVLQPPPLAWWQRLLLPAFSLLGLAAVVDGRRGRWNRFKWTLVACNALLTGYTVAGLACILLAYANVFDRSRIVVLADSTEMTLALVAMSLGLLTAIVGWSGILLNNRIFLAYYCFLLWPTLAFLVAPGYVAYRKRHFNLEGKTNYLWSRTLSDDHRRVIQKTFHCCGYQNPFVQAAVDGSKCYSRAARPGCKSRLLAFQRGALQRIYTYAFILVAPHMIVIVASLLCADHVTYRFGKGLTPKAYRLDEKALRVIREAYAANPPRSPSTLPEPAAAFYHQSHTPGAFLPPGFPRPPALNLPTDPRAHSPRGLDRSVVPPSSHVPSWNPDRHPLAPYHDPLPPSPVHPPSQPLLRHHSPPSPLRSSDDQSPPISGRASVSPPSQSPDGSSTHAASTTRVPPATPSPEGRARGGQNDGRNRVYSGSDYTFESNLHTASPLTPRHGIQ